MREARRFDACSFARYAIIRPGQAQPRRIFGKAGLTRARAQKLMPDRIIAMLKRPGEHNSQSNLKKFHPASDALRHRSLQSFCNSKTAWLKTVWSLESEVWIQRQAIAFDSRLSFMGDENHQ